MSTILVPTISQPLSPTESLTVNNSCKSSQTDGSISPSNLRTKSISVVTEPATKNVTFGIPNTRGFKMAALNIASLPKYIEELRNYMTSKSVDILAIDETHLDSLFSNTAISIPGYSLERMDRNRNG